MAGVLQLQNGTAPGTPASGTVYVYPKADKKLYLKDDSGTEFALALGTSITSTDDLPEGSTNLYFSVERAQDAVGSSLTATSTISFTYDDTSNQITAVVINDSITNAQIAPAANIALSKLAALATNQVAITNGSGVLTTSSITATELAALSGISGSIQTQLNAKQATGNYITGTTGDVVATGPGSVTATIQPGAVDNAKISNAAAIAFTKLATTTVDRVMTSNNAGFLTPSSVTVAELAHLAGVTSSIQTQLGTKANKSGDTFTGPVVVQGDNAGTGNLNLTAQVNNPATPTSGVSLFADNVERFGIKGQSGFAAILDDQSLTQDRVLTVPDQNGQIFIDPSTTTGDLIYRGGGGTATPLPIGSEREILRVLSGLPVWDSENLGQDFGDGNLGNVTLSGALTLTGPVYYDTLTIVAGCQLTTNGYPIYCKTLDLSNAPTAAIRWNGGNGVSALTQSGGGAGAGLVAQILGGSGGGTAGASGVVGAGAQSAAPTNLSPANGGAGGAGGGSGSGVNGGASGRGASTVSNRVLFGRLETAFIRGILQISGASGGAGGSSGGGDGVSATNATGGGGGGAGAGVIAIYADTIITSASTASGVIQAIGGNGGNGRTAPAAGTGGGGGGGGGAGGYVYIAFNNKIGPVISSLIAASGGNGGNGGNSVTGTGGAGGQGGQAGFVDLINFGTLTGTHVGGAAGTVGSLQSGTTGGVGGPGGVLNVSL